MQAKKIIYKQEWANVLNLKHKIEHCFLCSNNKLSSKYKFRYLIQGLGSNQYTIKFCPERQFDKNYCTNLGEPWRNKNDVKFSDLLLLDLPECASFIFILTWLFPTEVQICQTNY